MVKNMTRNLKEIKITGLILAGGRARRMDGVDKGLIIFNGKCMIEHCIERLRPQVDQVVISANRNIEQYSNYGLTVLEDNFGDFEGPLAGLLRALETSKNNPVLVVPCDAPLLPSDLANRLLESYVEGRTTAVIPHDGTRLQTLFGLYSRDAISPLTEYLASGQRKVENWISTLPHVVVDCSNEKERFMNINTKSDLSAAQSILNDARIIK